jgi:hypothetical protein
LLETEQLLPTEKGALRKLAEKETTLHQKEAARSESQFFLPLSPSEETKGKGLDLGVAREMNPQCQEFRIHEDMEFEEVCTGVNSPGDWRSQATGT